MTLMRFAAPAIVGVLFAAQNVSLARAQDYPTRPVTLVAPWPAGGTIDTLCRILGPKLSDRLGKPIIIENRAGAASVIGTTSVAKAAPDGYTLVMGGGTALAVAVTVYKKLGYDPTKDFVPIVLVSRIPFVLVVHPSLPVRSVPQLIKLAKEKPGQLSYASGGAPRRLRFVFFRPARAARRAGGASVDTCGLLSPRISPGWRLVKLRKRIVCNKADEKNFFLGTADEIRQTQVGDVHQNFFSASHQKRLHKRPLGAESR